MPHVSAVGVEQYLGLLILALITGGVGIAVMRSTPTFERLFAWLPIWLRPVIGGLMVGGMAIVTPQVLAAGHGAMVLDLHHEMTIVLIATIIALKVTACLVSLASGFRGGLFFASLFVGSLIGKFFAAVLLLLSPNFATDPLVAMLIGMATLGVAIVGGPLTMSFLVLEMTRNVDVTAVVLAGCIVTSTCVRFMFGHSFSTWRLHLRGETIRSANDVGWLRNLTVERMMRTDVAKVPSTTTIASTRGECALGSRPGIIVVNNADEYVGVVMLPDLFSSDLDAIADDIQVIELARFTDTALLSEMNVKTAMAMFDEAEAEMLAVFTSAESRKVIGFLTESFARRRYVEEIDRATQSVLGGPS
jgi:chloride channel protein, CIC family